MADQALDAFPRLEEELRQRLDAREWDDDEWERLQRAWRALDGLGDDAVIVAMNEVGKRLKTSWNPAVPVYKRVLGQEGLLGWGTRSAPGPGRVRRYGEIWCPRRIFQDDAKFMVVFTLKQHGAEGARAMEVATDVPVQVRLIAPGFEILGPDVQSVTIVEDADSAPASFGVRPARVGVFTLWIHVEQAGSPVSSMSIEVTVVAAAATEPPQRSATPVNLVPPTPTATPAAVPASPHNLLYVHHYRRDGAVYLHFLWVGADGPIGAPVDVDIGAAPETYAAGLYASLLALAQRVDPANPDAEPLTRAETAAKLDEIGATLWKEALPETIRAHLVAQGDALDGASLMICTDEPHIPWELVLPPAAPGAATRDPWCLRFDLARWYVSSGADEVAWRHSLPFERVVLLHPSDSGLPGAQREEADLEARLAKRNAARVRPDRLAPVEVKAFLGEQPYDWLHVTSHGLRVDPVAGGAVLVLEGGKTLSAAVVDDQVERNMIERRPAFVFNACDSGGQTFALSGIGGWAHALIHAGASLFLGTLWPVDDEQARVLSLAFYDALLGGATVGAALRTARATIRRPGETTWLAYTLYAHPNAKMAPAEEPLDIPVFV